MGAGSRTSEEEHYLMHSPGLLLSADNRAGPRANACALVEETDAGSLR